MIHSVLSSQSARLWCSAPTPTACDPSSETATLSPRASKLLQKPDLERNLQLGRESVEVVRQSGLRSYNNHTLGPRERQEVQQTYDHTYMARVGGRAPTFEQQMERSLAVARELQVGNCGIKSLMAYEHLRSRGVENLALITGSPKAHMDGYPVPHQFLVLGLDREADLSKPETWGENAVVVDPWYHLGDGEVGFALPAAEGLKHIENYFDIGYCDNPNYRLTDAIADDFPDSSQTWDRVRRRL